VSIPSWIWAVVAGMAPMALNFLLQSQLAKELVRNEHFPVPSDDQLRWHIRHTRQDVALIAYLLMVIINVLIYIAWRLTP
jgi:hypothetical protein